jgi:hypothetical protein
MFWRSRYSLMVFLTVGPTASLSLGCTGLVAGPESSAQTAVPVSSDTAWARVRRALASDVFTIDVVDSTHGHLVGTRYPNANPQPGSPQSCRMSLTLDIRGDSQQSEIATTSRWLAPEHMSTAPQLCERERSQVLERINTTVVPPTP